eukprot:gene13075-8353_t
MDFYGNIDIDKIENYEERKKQILERIKGDQDFSLEYIEGCKDWEKIRDDEDIIMASLETDSYNLKFASERLKDNENVVLEALNDTTGIHALDYASKRLKNDFNFIKK